MILKFFHKGGNGYDNQFVSVNGARPLQQQSGCPTMFESARLCDGLSISDEPIPGWAGNCTWSGYFYGTVAGYGQVVSGRLEKRVMEALGFKIKPEKWSWAADNQLHRCNADQIAIAMGHWGRGHTTKLNEYLAGLFPVEQPIKVNEGVPKKRKQKATAEITL